jgi:hypothetical protein
MTEILPALPYEAWRPTKETLHRFAQVVGKVSLAKGIRRNHWWHLTYRLTARGWTTVPLGNARQGPVFTIAFDFFDHSLRVASADGREFAFPLTGQSVASFHEHLMHALTALGLEVDLEKATPFDLPDKTRPFAEDTEHAEYDPARAQKAWRVLSQVGAILEEFSAGYSGKTSPVQLFWHSFDLAVTRFSDKRVEMPDSVDSVTREAYSREVISAGFWYGDAKVPEPTFYSYTAPEPAGLVDEPLRPDTAKWAPSGSGHTAMLRYDDARAAADPVGTVLDFLQSAYVAGASRAGWDLPSLACFGGITDPVLKKPLPGTSREWPEK